MQKGEEYLNIINNDIFVDKIEVFELWEEVLEKSENKFLFGVRVNWNVEN